MNAFQSRTLMIASVIALGVFALPVMKGQSAPASAAVTSQIAQVQPLNSAETPQDQLSDMEYDTPSRR